MIEEPQDNLPIDNVFPKFCYVAYLDILGFGTQVLNDFDSAVIAYREILDHWRWHFEFYKDVPAHIYSDSIILSSFDLIKIIKAVITLNMVTLMGDRLLRGGIGYGKHIEVTEDSHIYVVSEALTEAVSIEHNVRRPCVALSERIAIPSEWWTPHLRNIERGILYYDGLTLVNPLNCAYHRHSFNLRSVCREVS
jgi:hypothetical protein